MNHTHAKNKKREKGPTFVFVGVHSDIRKKERKKEEKKKKKKKKGTELERERERVSSSRAKTARTTTRLLREWWLCAFGRAQNQSRIV